jgi:RNA polymerase primary sigma factor
MRDSLRSTPILRIDLREIGRLPLLPKGEEVALALRIQQGDEDAQMRHIHGNLRLVVKVAKGYEGRGLDLLDLISEGNIGLMKAAERFNLPGA